MVGVLFLILAGLNINDEEHEHNAEIINNTVMIIIFFITIINAFISGFGIIHTDTTVRGEMEKQKMN